MCLIVEKPERIQLAAGDLLEELGQVLAPLAPTSEDEVPSELAPKTSLPMMLLAQVWARVLGRPSSVLVDQSFRQALQQLLGLLPLALVEVLVQRQHSQAT